MCLSTFEPKRTTSRPLRAEMSQNALNESPVSTSLSINEYVF